MMKIFLFFVASLIVDCQQSNGQSVSGLADISISCLPSFKFNPRKFGYHVTLPADIDSVTITAVPISNSSTISMTKDGHEFKNTMRLNNGRNSVVIGVTAPGENIKLNYVLNLVVFRSKKSDLLNVEFSSGDLSIPFSQTILNYDLYVRQGIDSISILDVSTSAKANIKYIYAGSETKSKFYVSPGSSILKILVTANDQETVKTYTFKIWKDPWIFV